ncbi:hypothetical protein ACQKKX_04515 [Neorhizobium sp. NPDC001467]|uniref:hypothetical protein n=1 Tax=Neorhizobium sp. NPDC001467 TaxID=3390595 RepID=UPI003D053215
MRAIVLAAVLVASTLSTAFAQEDDEERAFIIKQFKGWTGILLRCEPNSQHKAIADAICQSASAEFNYLAENSEIPHRISKDENSFQMYLNAGKLGTPLILELETLATTGAGGLTAVHVNLEARRFYSNAIEQDARPDNPESVPRGGDLVLWEHPMIASGYGEQNVVREMAPYVNDNIKSFFAQFLKGWKAK